MEVRYAEAGDIGAEFAEAQPLEAGIGFGSGEGLSSRGEAEDEPAGELFPLGRLEEMD